MPALVITSGTLSTSQVRVGSRMKTRSSSLKGVVAIVAVGLLFCACGGDGATRRESETPGAAACTAKGTALHLVAKDFKFSADCLAAPANADLTIEVDNQDPGTAHSLLIFSDSERTSTVTSGAAVFGPAQKTYSVRPGLVSGTYPFECSFHPDVMRGVLVVG